MLHDIRDSLLSNETIIPVIGFEMLSIKRGEEVIPYLDYLSEYIANKEAIPLKKSNSGFLLFNQLTHQLLVRYNMSGRETKKKISMYAGEIHNLVDTSYIEKIVSISRVNYFFNLTFTSHLSEIVNKKRTFPNTSLKQSNFPHEYKKPKNPDDLIKTDCSYEGVVYNIFGMAYQGQNTYYDYIYSDDNILEFIPSFIRWYESSTYLNNYKEIIKNASLLFLGCHYPDWLTRVMINTLKPGSVAISNETIARIFFDYCNDISNSFFLAKHNFVFQEKTPTLKLVNELNDLLIKEGFIIDIKNDDFVFVSYTRDNHLLAQKIICDLAGKLNVWFDRIKLFPGDLINEEVKMGIDNCVLFLPLITNESVKKTPNDYVKQEWRYYFDKYAKNPKIIPMVNDDVNLGTLGFDIDMEFTGTHSNIFRIVISNTGLQVQDVDNVANRFSTQKLNR